MEDAFEEGEPPLHLGSHTVKRPPAAARVAEDEIEPPAAKGQADQVFSDSMSRVSSGRREPSKTTATSHLAFFHGTSATVLANPPPRLPTGPGHLQPRSIAK